MDHILIVEDSRILVRMYLRAFEEFTEFQCTVAGSYKDAVEILEKHRKKFLIAVLDLKLPDALEGEIVELCTEYGLPSIVMTGNVNEEIRKKILTQNVIDYVEKEGPHSIYQMIHTIRRFRDNRTVSVLVADDSSTIRNTLKKALEKQSLTVYLADNGRQALDVIAQNPQIKVAVIDYNMPEMNGFDLTLELRKKYSGDEMAIIGMSSQGNELLSVKFLKKGASDFIIKPFSDEELVWRLHHNINMLDYIEKIRNAAVRDFLTGLSNRRYFFEKGERIYKKALSENQTVFIAMMDIDFFKKVNDTFGHDAGDDVLKSVSSKIREHFSDKHFLASRFGGEEFCLLVTGLNREEVEQSLESFRKDIEEMIVPSSAGDIHVTVSTGVSPADRGVFDGDIKQADLNLYQAKESGRNKVVYK